MSGHVHTPEICHQLFKFGAGPDSSIYFGISFHHELNVYCATAEEDLFAVCTRCDIKLLANSLPLWFKEGTAF